MISLPPPVLIKADSIADSFGKTIAFIMKKGEESKPDYNTTTKRCNAKIVIDNPMKHFYTGFYADAEGKIKDKVSFDHTVHLALRKDPYIKSSLGAKAFQAYIERMDGDFAKIFDKMDPETRDPYNYVHRLKMHPSSYGGSFDQLAYIRSILGNRVGSRRIKANLWIPGIDLVSAEDQPCFQEVKFENLGDGQCHVEISFRSWDAWKGYPSNIPAICNLLFKEVLEPNNLNMTRLTCNGSDLHIYEENWDDAGRMHITAADWDDILYF